MKTKLLMVLLGIFFISIVSASTTISPISADTLGVYQQNQPLDLIQLCSNSTSPCDGCNISTVKLPNSSTLLNNTPMMSRGDGEFNFTLVPNQTETIGEHLVNGNCFVGNEVTIFTYTYIINRTGEILSTAQGLVYIVFLIASLFLTLSQKIKITIKNVKTIIGHINANIILNNQ